MSKNPQADWYQLKDIRLSDRQHWLWLLRYLPSLREGNWLEAMHYESDDSKLAVFQTPIELVAEMDKRLEAAGIDGAMLEDCYSNHRTWTSIAKQYQVSWWAARQAIYRALRYVSDSNAHRDGKDMNYDDWKRGRRKRSGNPV